MLRHFSYKKLKGGKISMIYSKLDGTTSKKFKLGKNGVELQDDNGKLAIQENDGPIRRIGISNIRIPDVENDIPTSNAVNFAIDSKIRTVTQYEVDYLNVTGQIKMNDYIFVEKGGN